jgi:hypothetical protein
MTGTEAQIEWAGRIRMQLDQEFDRVATALSRTAAASQKAEAIPDLLAILEEKRKEILSNDRAGYFIQTWQEPAGRIRTLILADPRYAEIRARFARATSFGDD